MAWEPRLIILHSWWILLCGCFEYWCVNAFKCVCVCVCVWVYVHSPTAVFPAGARLLKENTQQSSGGEILFVCVCECKSQCLGSCAVSPRGFFFFVVFCFFERTFSGLEACARLARAHTCAGVFPCASSCLCMCLRGLLRVIVMGVWLPFDHDSSMEKQITFQCRGDRKALSGWQTSPADLIPFSFHWQTPGLQEVVRGRWIGFVCEYNSK